MSIRTSDRRYRAELSHHDRPGRRDPILHAIHQHPDLAVVTTLSELAGIIRDRDHPNRGDRALRTLLTHGLDDSAVAATLIAAFVPALTGLVGRHPLRVGQPGDRNIHHGLTDDHHLEELVAICWLKLATTPVDDPAPGLYRKIVGRVARRAQLDRQIRQRINRHETIDATYGTDVAPGQAGALSDELVETPRGIVSGRPDNNDTARPDRRALDRLALQHLAVAVQTQIDNHGLDPDEWRTLIARRIHPGATTPASAVSRSRASKLVARLRDQHPDIDAHRAAA